MQCQAVKFIVFIVSSILIFSTISSAEYIDAPTAVVIDAQTGRILYGKNPHFKHPPASTSKLVTAMVALDYLSPERKVTISGEAAKTPSFGIKLMEGEIYTVKDLIYLALMGSVNSATVAIAEAVSGSEDEFVKVMNEKVKRIGAKNTKFANSSGLPGGQQYTTVYDLSKIMSYALNYPLIVEALNTRVSIIRSDDGKEHFIQNTNQLLWTEENMIGGKTGYTRKAKHCFVSATRLNNRVVYTALLGVPSRERLWKDTQLLLAKAEDVLSGKIKPVVQITDNKPIIKASYKKLKSSNKKNSVKIKIKNKMSVKKAIKQTR
jgi:D-alanyl-D-alanine carboxypeptidase (penicillin-binding protein 5/6)